MRKKIMTIPWKYVGFLKFKRKICNFWIVHLSEDKENQLINRFYDFTLAYSTFQIFSLLFNFMISRCWNHEVALQTAQKCIMLTENLSHQMGFSKVQILIHTWNCREWRSIVGDSFKFSLKTWLMSRPFRLPAG